MDTLVDQDARTMDVHGSCTGDRGLKDCCIKSKLEIENLVEQGLPFRDSPVIGCYLSMCVMRSRLL